MLTDPVQDQFRASLPDKGRLLRRLAALIVKVKDVRGMCFKLDVECAELEGELAPIERALEEIIDDYMAMRLHNSMNPGRTREEYQADRRRKHLIRMQERQGE